MMQREPLDETIDRVAREVTMLSPTSALPGFVRARLRHPADPLWRRPLVAVSAIAAVILTLTIARTLDSHDIAPETLTVPQRLDSRPVALLAPLAARLAPTELALPEPSREGGIVRTALEVPPLTLEPLSLETLAELPPLQIESIHIPDIDSSETKEPR
jgi:hypothetical protein